jgi:hypothetical protein
LRRGIPPALTIVRYQWHADRAGLVRSLAIKGGVLGTGVAATTVAAIAFSDSLKKLLIWCLDGTVLELDWDEKEAAK